MTLSADDRAVLEVLDTMAFEQFARDLETHLAFMKLTERDYDAGPLRKGATIPVRLPKRFTVNP